MPACSLFNAHFASPHRIRVVDKAILTSDVGVGSGFCFTAQTLGQWPTTAPLTKNKLRKLLPRRHRPIYLLASRLLGKYTGDSASALASS